MAMDSPHVCIKYALGHGQSASGGRLSCFDLVL